MVWDDDLIVVVDESGVVYICAVMSRALSGITMSPLLTHKRGAYSATAPPILSV